MTDFATILAELRDNPHPSEREKDNARRRTPKYKATRKTTRNQANLDSIAIFDTETNPFDNKSAIQIRPFLGILYWPSKAPYIIWENDFERFCDAFEDVLRSIDTQLMIYAHNGGRFDFKFLLRRMRGRVRTKGGSIMEYQVHGHTLRDSLHILPVSLATYNKQEFDYNKLARDQRDQYKQEIIDYCLSDCENQYAIVHEFIKRHGFKLSIGQAAMTELKKHYTYTKLGPFADTKIREFYFGGRVECLHPVGEYHGNFTLYDVNSMYPYVMARYKHPVATFSNIGTTITHNTVFIKLRCKNRGAFATRGNDGIIDCNITDGEFYTTIHEYEAACDLDLIDNVRVIQTIDFSEQTDFFNFIIPAYERRRELKTILKDTPKEAPEYLTLHREELLIKLLLNNSYGKFAQNPESFRETFITDPNSYPTGKGSEGPLWGKQDKKDRAARLPDIASDHYWIWRRKPETLTHYNVATAASITGAARSVLLRALAKAERPLYCDTDSIIAEGLHPDTRIDHAELGCWKPEQTAIHTVRLGGKKIYGYQSEHAEVVKCKGARLTWLELGRIIAGETVSTVAQGPALAWDGTQSYIERAIKATGKRK